MARPKNTDDNGALGKGASRTIVSLPQELTAALDTRISAEGGDALRNLGVGPETLRTAFVHKLLREALAAELKATETATA